MSTENTCKSMIRLKRFYVSFFIVLLLESNEGKFNKRLDKIYNGLQFSKIKLENAINYGAICQPLMRIMQKCCKQQEGGAE